jgi:hypothetical protein
MFSNLPIYLRAWWPMLLPAVSAFAATAWWLWPLSLAIPLAAAVGLGVFFFATFVYIAVTIAD